jgi:hypothetical protein
MCMWLIFIAARGGFFASRQADAQPAQGKFPSLRCGNCPPPDLMNMNLLFSY